MRWKAHMKKITSRLSVNTRCCNFPPHSSCSDFSPPSPVYCPGRDSSTRRNEAHDILRGESCCQPGPLEPTYCVFAEAAVEQNAALGSISHTSREQDEALLALLALLAQRTGLSLYHIQRERETTRSSWEMISWRGWARQERERGTKWDGPTCWPGPVGSVPSALCLCSPRSAVDCNPGLQIFLPSWDLRFNQLLILSETVNLCSIHS